MIAFDPDNRIAFCNPTAFAAFDCADAAEFAEAGYPRIATSRDGAALGLDALLAPGREIAWGYLQTPGGTRACVFGAGDVRHGDGVVSRRFVTFLELDDYRAQITRLSADSGRLNDEVTQLRLTLNQCMTLLQVLQKPPPDGRSARPVAVQLAVADWIAQQGADRRNAVRHDVLPIVQGDPEEVGILIASAIEAVLAAAGTRGAAVFVHAEPAGEGTVRLIFELQADRGRTDVAKRAPAADSARTLALAILSRLLARQGGKLVESRFDAADIRLAITLPASEDG